MPSERLGTRDFGNAIAPGSGRNDVFGLTLLSRYALKSAWKSRSPARVMPIVSKLKHLVSTETKGAAGYRIALAKSSSLNAF